MRVYSSQYNSSRAPAPRPPPPRSSQCRVCIGLLETLSTLYSVATVAVHQRQRSETQITVSHEFSLHDSTRDESGVQYAHATGDTRHAHTHGGTATAHRGTLPQPDRVAHPSHPPRPAHSDATQHAAPAESVNSETRDEYASRSYSIRTVHVRESPSLRDGETRVCETESRDS